MKEFNRDTNFYERFIGTLLKRFYPRETFNFFFFCYNIFLYIYIFHFACQHGNVILFYFYFFSFYLLIFLTSEKSRIYFPSSSTLIRQLLYVPIFRSKKITITGNCWNDFFFLYQDLDYQERSKNWSLQTNVPLIIDQDFDSLR